MMHPRSRQIVTAHLMGDPPADLAERRAEAEARERNGASLKTRVQNEFHPGRHRRAA